MNTRKLITLPTRRNVFAGSMAALVLPGLAAVAEAKPADAELLRLGRQFDQAKAVEQAAWDALDAVESYDDDHPLCVKAIALGEAVGLLVDQIEPLPAQTMAALLVKARAIAWCHGGDAPSLSLFDCYCTKQQTHTVGDRLVVSVLTDLHAMTGRVGA